jgi:hypothetical protein
MDIQINNKHHLINIVQRIIMKKGEYSILQSSSETITSSTIHPLMVAVVPSQLGHQIQEKIDVYTE